MKHTTSSRVSVIPNFINTPLDVLALGLFDLLTPLALEVAEIDGNKHQAEKALISSYFIDQWGYDRIFVDEGIKFTESRLSNFTIKEIAQTLADFKKENPYCNYDAISKEILEFSHDVMEAGGRINEREEMAIAKVQSIFKETGKFSLAKSAKAAWELVSSYANKLFNKFKRNT